MGGVARLGNRLATAGAIPDILMRLPTGGPDAPVLSQARSEKRPRPESPALRSRPRRVREPNRTRIQLPTSPAVQKSEPRRSSRRKSRQSSIATTRRSIRSSCGREKPSGCRSTSRRCHSSCMSGSRPRPFSKVSGNTGKASRWSWTCGAIRNGRSPIKPPRAYEYRDDWVNRMILGDSLVIVNSLLEYEGLGGHVQMIYIDPPYGVKFGSNFQPFVRKRDVKHNDDADMTREPEMVQAYRDTWELGIHSYLTYLRDRLMLARDLLTPSGSVFVQIGEENVHRARDLLDEVFGAENFVSLITFAKTSSATNEFLPATSDFVLFYARDREALKYRALLIRLQGDGERYFVLETKGFDPLADVKAAAAHRWVRAVNADGRYGTWHFAMARSVSDVSYLLSEAARSRDPIRDAAEFGVDIGQLRESLRRTPEDRLRQLDANAAFLAELRKSGRRRRGQKGQ